MGRKKSSGVMGKPLIWKNAEELKQDIERYFAYCKDEEKPPTIAGLAYYLKVDRQTIYNYSYKEDYFDIIKRARERIMMNLEETAIIKGNAGTIFVMKQYGYKDRIDTSIDVSKEVSGAVQSFLGNMEKE